MKKHVLRLLILAILLQWPLFAADADTNEWDSILTHLKVSIRLKGDSNEVKTNEPVHLMIHIENLSSNQTFFWVYGGVPTISRHFYFIITAPSGKDVSPAYSRIPGSGSANTLRIKPGESDEYETDLEFDCKFDEVGTYKIVLVFGGTTKEINAKSNVLSLSVVPGK